MTPTFQIEVCDAPLVVTLQFIDEAHACFYDLGAMALTGLTPNSSAARALRDRMLPFMDLSDARNASAFVGGMGGRERIEFRLRGLIGVRRFIGWAMEYAEHVREEASKWPGEAETCCVYDPELLLDVVTFLTRSRGVGRRTVHRPRRPP